MRLSIDPGTQCGAAVLVGKNGVVIKWWVWTQVSAGYRITGESGVWIALTMYEVGQIIASCCHKLHLERLFIEGLFGGDSIFGNNPLVESVGELRAGLRSRELTWPEDVWRPLAVQRRKKPFTEKEAKRFGVPAGSRPPAGWRMKCLGLPDKMTKTKAEEACIEDAMERGVLPRGLRTKDEQGAWAEAYTIGRWTP
jgi:hypothetical protein